MAILQDASTVQVARLLALFPVSRLRQTWPDVGAETKEALCQAVASERPREQITNFVDTNFGCAKQHVYVFDRPKGADLPETITDGEKVTAIATRALYLTKHTRAVVLRDPLEQTSITFLWPVRVERIGQYVIVRFVILEKDISSYFDRRIYPGQRGTDEKDILSSISAELDLVRSDLHKGTKKLWDEDFFDAHSTRYRTPRSVASEAMYDEKGIKANNSEPYDKLQTCPMGPLICRIPPGRKLTVTAFSIDPSQGTLAFHRYSETPGDSDRVIREILKKN
jgi:hypothetical protein